LDYTYAVGRIRALENRLIHRDVFLESVEEKNFPSAVKVLFDAGTFHEEIEEIKNTQKLDGFLKKEYQSLLSSTSDLFLEKRVMRVIEEEYSPEKALNEARETGYSFIIDYVRHKIDLGNLKILARVKYLELKKEKLNKVLMDGGFIQRYKIKRFYDLSYSDINEALKFSPYFKAWSEGMDALQEKESFVEMEREFEDFLMEYLRNARYIVFGPEPVFTYVLSKKKELDLFRLVGIGKINRIPKNFLKNRISKTYV
jgi:V/A-type H+-transporting ATPase subunit C